MEPHEVAGAGADDSLVVNDADLDEGEVVAVGSELARSGRSVSRFGLPAVRTSSVATSLPPVLATARRVPAA